MVKNRFAERRIEAVLTSWACSWEEERGRTNATAIFAELELRFFRAGNQGLVGQSAALVPKNLTFEEGRPIFASD
jgi:hypothetical protein